MKQTTFAILVAGALHCSTDAQAQRRQDAGLTVTVARHSIQGGHFARSTSGLLDVLAAGRVRTMRRWSMVAAGGVGVIFDGFTERCLVLPDGDCSPQGNFVAVEALLGMARPIGRLRARVMAGPALHSGAEDTSLGVQMRVDLSAPASTHLGLGAMLRATFSPSHDGERLMLWAAGGTLTFR